MEHMPLIILILYSIPESIVLISLGSALYGYDVRANLKRIIILGISLAAMTYIIRALPIKFGYNVALQIPLFVVLTSYFLQTSVKKTIVIILTGFIILSIAETAIFPISVKLSGLDLNIIIEKTFLRLLLSWSVLITLIIPAIIVIWKKISFISAYQLLKTTTLNTKISFMILIVLIQALLAGMLQLTYIHEEYSVWQIPIEKALLQQVIGIALITIPIISIFLLKRLFDLSQQEAIAATQEAFLDNVRHLFVTVKGQRHDFINHIQVIYSLLKTDQKNEAVNYMDNLLDEIQEVSETIKVRDPALSALLNTKLAAAERHNVILNTSFQTSIESLNVKTLDLVKILGNLLDNAIEAVKNQPSEFRKVGLTIKKVSDSVQFEVHNPAPVIPPEYLESIFEGGFTTKQDEGHSGLGLAIVKDMTRKYNGQVGIRSSKKEGTIFTVKIPW